MKNFIVFDLEWNQNPGGKEASVERLPFEIFEIGAVKLNEEREKVAEFHRIIRPCVYRQMHRIISEVTHVSIEELERDGEPFAAVMEDFLKWCGEDCIFCTWGSMDLTELQRNMVYHGMTIPFPKPFLFYDVQKLYSLSYQDGKARISLDEAVESFALDVDAPFHRALGDAEYTGRVLQAMDFDSVKDYVSVDYYLPPEQIHFKLGKSYVGMKQYEKALSEFKAGHKINPNEPNNVIGLANICFNKNVAAFCIYGNQCIEDFK